MSNSRVFLDRFQTRNRRRRVVAFVYVAATLAYLGWRTTIINEDALGLSLTFFVAEVLGFILALTLIFSSWTYRHRDPPSTPRGLKVDVFIPTYREPVDLVRWTVLAAINIEYPHQTFLLDDGNRPEMKALAEELGVRYLARGRNINAKAGNLNYGLAHSTADFVAVFDADHIALPNALDLTLGFFRDERVAMVQTPQDFYNTDAFQYMNVRGRGGLWHDQSFFYGIAEPCRDSLNGASCMGTGVVYRRSALDAIGGIPTETVTEDLHTSLKMHKLGYDVVYLNEPIAYGVAAADLREFYKTRHRWAHGNIHALRIENILFCKNLTFGQRLSYLTLGVIYLEGWQQLILFIVPLMSLFLGWAPFDITFKNVLAVLLFPVFTSLLLQELGCGLSRYWVNEIYGAARFPIHIAATLALISGPMRFRTSAKNIRGEIEWTLMSPQLVVLALSLLAVAVGSFHLMIDFQVGPLAKAFMNLSTGNIGAIDWNARLDQGYTLELVVVSGFWALFNAAKSGYVIHKATSDAKQSSADYRFEVPLPIEIARRDGPLLASIDRISSRFLSIAIYGDDVPAVGEWLQGTLYLPSGPLAVDVVVTRVRQAKHTVARVGPVTVEIVNAPDEAAQIECNFVWASDESRDRLMRSLYSVDWHREFMHRQAFFLTPFDAMARLMTLRWPRSGSAEDWKPGLCRIGGGDPVLAIVGLTPGTLAASLIVFQSIKPGTIATVEIPGPAGPSLHLLRIVGSEPLHSLGRKGLDGAEVRKCRATVEAVPAAAIGPKIPMAVE